jgi:large subunit ribosomal protein L18
MAKGPQYRVPFRRRRQGKTDYYLRRSLLVSRKDRFVVRKSSKHILAQIITPRIKGDRTIVSAHTIELVKDYNWKASTGNMSAAYLVGYLAGKKAIQSGIKSAILDIGNIASTKGSRIFAVLKGALDTGLKIPHNENILPSEDRIKGKHIVDFYQSVSKQGIKDNKQQFGKIKSGKIDLSKLSEHFEEVKKKIDAGIMKKTPKTIEKKAKITKKRTVKSKRS